MRHAFRALAIPALAAGLVASHLTLAAPARAQTSGDLAFITLATPMPGHAADFQEGLREYFAANDGMGPTWGTWEIMTGDHTGSFYVGAFGHSWAGFDEVLGGGPPPSQDPLFQEHIAPHMESMESSFWRIRPELSHGSGPEGPSPMEQLIYLRVNDAQAFEAILGDMVAAAEAANWAGEWGAFQLVNGGEGPLYLVTIFGKSFADFEEPSPAMPEMLLGQMGERGAAALFESMGDVVEWERTEMIAHRPDLGPGQQ